MTDRPDVELHQPTKSRPDRPAVATGPSQPHPGTAEVLLNVILAERERRDSALDALQTKVGILLGLAAVLVVLAAEWPQWWQRLLSALPALLAAVVCILNLRTRRVEALDMRKTRDAYLAGPPDVAARGILDTLVGRTQEMDGALAAARRTTNWSVGLLCGSTLVNFVLVIVT